MKKTYECDLISLSMSVTINGKARSISFRGGSYGGGMSSNARYVTQDEEEMKAIEASDRFKSGRIINTKVEGEPTAKKQTPATAPVPPLEPVAPATAPVPPLEPVAPATAPVPPLEPVAPATAPVEPGKGTEYPEVTNYQQARNILITKHDVVFDGRGNKEAVLKAAGDRNITFPNWN